MIIKSYRDLEVWQKARNLVACIYRFLDIAYGSVAEVETQLYIVSDLNFTTEKKIELLLSDYSEVGRMLNGLLSSLNRKKSESRIPNPESFHAQTH